MEVLKYEVYMFSSYSGDIYTINISVLVLINLVIDIVSSCTY